MSATIPSTAKIAVVWYGADGTEQAREESVMSLLRPLIERHHGAAGHHIFRTLTKYSECPLLSGGKVKVERI